MKKIVIILTLVFSTTHAQAANVISRECVNQFEQALTLLNGDEGVTFARISSFVEIKDTEEESRSFTLGAMVRIDSESVDESPVVVNSVNKFFTTICVMQWPKSTNYRMSDVNGDGILNQSDFSQLNLKD